MTDLPSLRPDARLVQLHAERGDPHGRLAAALAALEDTDWGLLLAGEAALARQLAALLGPGTLRVDGRLDVGRAALAEAGLAVADLHGDLAGARAVWLLEPDRAAVERARRAGVRVIVDATLAPGGGWPRQGADYVVYRNAVTLTGHADAPLAALFGSGTAPTPAAPPPSDLAVALALRDVATLPLRLARFARTATQLTDRLGASVRQAGPTALLLAPDSAADTPAQLGGVLAAARHVPDGLLLTPGLEDPEQVLALLRDPPEAQRQDQRASGQGEASQREQGQREERHRSEDRPRDNAEGRAPADREDRPERRSEQRVSRPERSREDRPREDRFRDDRRREGRRDRFRPSPGPDRPTRTGERRDDAPARPAELERFTFEAPQQAPVPAPAEDLPWEPEIVFSDHAPQNVPLTHTVSSGPDAPPLPLTPPLADTLSEADAGDAAAQVTPAELFVAEHAAPVPSEAQTFEPQVEAPEPEAAEPQDAAAAEEAPTVEDAEASAAQTPAEPLAPDLPSAPPAPTADAAQDGPAADLTDEQAAIYARLREWRNAEAKRQEISRFIVASNAALAEIARRVPYTLEDLAAVRGMGPARLGKYGEKILEVVRG
ncbi:HRDC domain-containing protein [Deinococcus sp. PESE-13]